jgi:hypothetical protein
MKTIPTATQTQSFAATMTIAAILGLAAGPTTARAWDRQASEAAMNSELSHRAAQAVAPRHAWSGAYDSAHSDARGTASGGAQRDFKVEGR